MRLHPPRHRPGRIRTLLPVLIVLLVGAGLILFLHRQHSDFQVSLTDPGPQSSTPHAVVTVAGEAASACEVQLSVNFLPHGKTETDAQGRFTFESVPLRPGSNWIEVRATGAGWWRRTAHAGRDLRYEPDPPSPPKLLPLPPKVNQPLVVLRGTVESGSEVLVTINDQEQKPAKPEISWDGRFRQEYALPKPAEYRITVQSRDQKGRLSRPSPPVQVTYDPSWSAAVPATSRTLTAHLAHKTIKLEVEVVLPSDDPRVVALAGRKTTLEQFVSNLFNGLLFGNYAADSFFYGATPVFSTADGKTTVRATSRPELSKISSLPLFAGSLTIHWLNSVPQSGSLTLTLDVSDYAIDAVEPPPARRSAAKLTWSAEDGLLPWEVPLTVRLRYDPAGHPFSLARLLDLSPGQWLPYPGWVLGALVQTFFSALPLLWMLALLRRYGHNGIDPAVVRRFEHSARDLVTVAFLAPQFGVAMGVAALLSQKQWMQKALGWLDEQLRERLERPDDSFRLELMLLLDVGILLLVGLAAWAGLWAARFLKRDRAGCWVEATCRALRDSAWLALAPFAVVLALTLVPQDVIGYEVFATLAAFPFLAFLASEASAWWAPAQRGRRILAGVLTGLLCLFLAYPSGSAILSALAMPVHQTVAYNLSLLFATVQPLIPCIGALGMLALVRRLGQDGPADETHVRGLAFGAGMIFFCWYLVGTRDTWFGLVPVAFLLALWVYPRFVLKPAAERAALDSLAPTVRARRADLLDHALLISEAQQMKDSLDRLKKKVFSGDLSLGDFEKRKAEIDKRAAAYETGATLEGGLHVDDVVLSVGPRATDWANGLWTVQCAWKFVLPLVAVYVVAGLPDVSLGHAYLALWAVVRFLSVCTEWLLAAFFFGYCFTHLHGDSGLKKGVRVALLALACLLPAWLVAATTSSELTALFLRGTQLFLFFPILGVWAFDYRTLADTLGDRFHWKRLAWLGGVRPLTASASVLVASAGVAINSVLSGQFTTIAGILIRSVFPQAPVGPTK